MGVALLEDFESFLQESGQGAGKDNNRLNEVQARSLGRTEVVHPVKSSPHSTKKEWVVQPLDVNDVSPSKRAPGQDMLPHVDIEGTSYSKVFIEAPVEESKRPCRLQLSAMDSQYFHWNLILQNRDINVLEVEDAVLSVKVMLSYR